MGVDLIHSLQLGRVPRVVGTIITAEFLEQWASKPHNLPCDLVEFRVDGFPQFSDWIRIGAEIQRRGIPVFATVRLAREGGKWISSDKERWPLLEGAIHHLAGIDVELESELANRACQLAAEQAKFSVVSHHNFERTPPLSELSRLIEHAHQIGTIGKIAASANIPEDVENLRRLLQTAWKKPLCVIGMGPLGRDTRLQFPLEGSCFTYGYLDTPGAPGQFSAAELWDYYHPQKVETRKDGSSTK
jgi:3-dehydroquinate dehydratase I